MCGFESVCAGLNKKPHKTARENKTRKSKTARATPHGIYAIPRNCRNMYNTRVPRPVPRRSRVATRVAAPVARLGGRRHTARAGVSHRAHGAGAHEHAPMRTPHAPHSTVLTHAPARHTVRTCETERSAPGGSARPDERADDTRSALTSVCPLSHRLAPQARREAPVQVRSTTPPIVRLFTSHSARALAHLKLTSSRSRSSRSR